MLVVTFFQLQIHQSVTFLFPVFCLEVQFQANFCSFEDNLSFFLLVALKNVFLCSVFSYPLSFLNVPTYGFLFINLFQFVRLKISGIMSFFFFDSSKRVPHSISWVHRILLQRYTIIFFFYAPLV